MVLLDGIDASYPARCAAYTTHGAQDKQVKTRTWMRTVRSYQYKCVWYAYYTILVLHWQLLVLSTRQLTVSTGSV